MEFRFFSLLFLLNKIKVENNLVKNILQLIRKEEVSIGLLVL